MRRSRQRLSKGTAEMRHRYPALLRDCLERQVVRAEAFIHQLHGPPLLPGCKPPARSALFYPQLAITLEHVGADGVENVVEEQAVERLPSFERGMQAEAEMTNDRIFVTGGEGVIELAREAQVLLLRQLEKNRAREIEEKGFRRRRGEVDRIAAKVN